MTITGETLVVRGCMTVAPDVKLTLVGVQLTLTCSTHDPWILVKAGAELVVKDRDGDPSTTWDATCIRTGDPDVGCVLTYAEGSKGSVSCSVLDRVSIFALNDALTVTGCTFNEVRIGAIVGRSCDLTVEQTAIVDALSYGVHVEGGSLQMRWCTVNETSASGITILEGAVAQVSNCSVDGAAWYGAHVMDSTIALEDCSFRDCFVDVLLQDVVGVEIRRCTFRDQVFDSLPFVGRFYGLKVAGTDDLLLTGCLFEALRCTTVCVEANVTLRQCTFSRCKVGLSTEGLSLKVDACTFVDNDVGFEIAHRRAREISVMGCTFDGNRVGIAVADAGSTVPSIEDCSIENSLSAGVRVEGAAGENSTVSLRNCTMSGAEFGVRATNASIEMERCTLEEASMGVEMSSGSTATLRNCTISVCGHGIVVRDSVATIEDCAISRTYSMCDLIGANGTVLRRCILSVQMSSNDYGIYMDGTGAIAVTGCTFDRCGRTLLCGDVEFRDNRVNGSGTGVVVDSGRVVLTGCTFSSNTVGALVVGRAGQGHVFERCSFLGNVEAGAEVGAPEGWTVLATLRNCTFEGNGGDGLRIGGGGHCLLVDPRFAGNGGRGLDCLENGTMEWVVEGRSSSANETSYIRGNVTVGPHGTLALTNAALRFVNEGFATYGIVVRGGTLVLEDLDGNPDSEADASWICSDSGEYPDSHTSFLSLTDGGVLHASCSRFTFVPVAVDGGWLELEACLFEAWWNDNIVLRNSTGASVIRGCGFHGGKSGVRAWNSSIEIDDCFMNSNTCIEAQYCDALSVARTTMRGWWRGIHIERCRSVAIEGLTVEGDMEGVTVLEVDDLSIVDTVISRCSGWGMYLARCDVAIASSIVRDTGIGMVATDCAIVIDGLVIRGTDEWGLLVAQSALTAYGLWVNETGTRAAEFSGGAADLTDSHLDSLGYPVLLARDDAMVRCYNTTIEGLGASAKDDAIVEVYHQVRVTTTLMDGRRPPATLWIALTDARGTRALTAPLGRAATTGWMWIMQLAITADGTVFRTPYTAEVSLEGRSVRQAFDVKGRTDVIVELGHDIVAAIVDPGDVEEGVEAAIDGGDSWSWPFDISLLEWDVDYDGVFTADGWGETLWWTFRSNGTHKVALRATDETGMRATAVAVVHVLDAGPTVIIVPPPPGEVGEDEPVEMDGRVATNADVVEYVAWDLGDGRVLEGTHPIVSWPRAGTYVVTLTAVDMDGSRATAHATMTVLNLPPVAVVPRVRLEAGRHVPFMLDGSRSSDTPSDMASLRYEWVVEGVGRFEGVRPNVTFDSVGEFRVTLTVTDDDGASSAAVMTVVVANAPPVVGRLEDVSMRRTDGPLELPLSGRIKDPDGEAGALAVAARSSRADLVKVKVSALADGTYVLTVTPVGADGATGRAVVTVTLRDRDGGTAEGSFNVTVLPTPEAAEEAAPAWVLPSLVISAFLIVAAVALISRWARARRT